jgi:uncharacterized coiled-coil protein SlyX
VGYRIGNGSNLYDEVTGNLVGFIDENGREQLLQASVSGVTQQQLDDLAGVVDTQATSITSLAATVAAQATTISTLNSTVSAQATTITALQASVTSLTSSVASLTSSVAAVPVLIDNTLSAVVPFTYLLNAVSVAGRGPSYTWPGGLAAFHVSCSSWAGAIVTLQKSTDGGAHWTTLTGPKSSFGADGEGEVSDIVTGALVSALVTGAPGAAITAYLEG